MKTEHYFESVPKSLSDEQIFGYTFRERNFRFITDNGVFSKGHVDPETFVLMETVFSLFGTDAPESFLDLGCGYGVVGIIAKTLFPNMNVMCSDINQRALELSRKNCDMNNVFCDVAESDCFGNIECKFDAIAVNPPIHAGKTVMYKMYEDSRVHLNANGALYVVIAKKHGGESTKKKLSEIFSRVDVVYKKKSIFVFAGKL